MDLWIRTQDRTGILKADTIFVFEKQIVKRVYGDDLVKGICLGTYATEERALEVLDEIQKILIGRLIIKTNRKVGSKDLNRLANFFDTKYVINDNEFEFIQPEATNIIYAMPKE